MMPFELVEPTSIQEALGLLDPDDPSVRPISGGTALLMMMKAGVFHPRRLVSLRKLGKRFAEIQVGGDGSLVIGAMASLADLERSPVVARHTPVIGQAMRRLANVRVRNVASVGGSLAHGDPHMDLPPVLIALDARVTVVSPSGERTLKVEDLFEGYYETVLKYDELITELTIPPQGTGRTAYLKCTAGSADDWPALVVAVGLEAEGARVNSARVVVSAATDNALRLGNTEGLLAGARVDETVLRRAADAAAEEVEPLADIRGSAAYKRELLRVYVVRAVRKAIGAGTT
ncbi:MAG: xanthine dehydrogenase family protein subunit M [Desulfobacterales bacterium]|nr:MAG: xanthine dehydrogenase family protein subunit M [Desulfobacterales bacterium]